MIGHSLGGLDYFRDYYFERGRALAPGQWEAACLIHLQQRAADDASVRYRIDRAWEALTRAIVDEARRVMAALPPGPLDSETPLPEYDLLKPLAHRGIIGERLATIFAQQLRWLGQRDNWQPRDVEVRPALGLVGVVEVKNEEFFRPKINSLTFDEVNQSTWLFEHSAMKYPTEEIFMKSYQEGIMRRMQKNSRFGRY